MKTTYINFKGSERLTLKEAEAVLIALGNTTHYDIKAAYCRGEKKLSDALTRAIVNQEKEDG